MAEVLQITIPEDVRARLNRTPEEMGRDLRLYAALMLFRLGKLSSGAAAELAGVPRVDFLDLCAEYGLTVSALSVADLHQETAAWGPPASSLSPPTGGQAEGGSAAGPESGGFERV
ncbi:MAG: UPF0175 family protein [Acidobacteria bacterium]|nr:UPF0175 family protein [Acidobacteriota bacterium]